MRRATAIVPVKALEQGKSRLSSSFTPPERHRLCGWMVGRTLQRLSTLADVIVVSDDPTVEPLVAVASNARFLRVDPSADLNGALSQARANAASDFPLVIVPTDLVLLETQDIDSFLLDPQTLSIVPDRAGKGTNLLWLPPAVATMFSFAFGEDSFSRHRAEASRLGLDARVVRSDRLGLDVDTAADLGRAGLVALGAGHILTLPENNN